MQEIDLNEIVVLGWLTLNNCGKTKKKKVGRNEKLLYGYDVCSMKNLISLRK